MSRVLCDLKNTMQLGGNFGIIKKNKEAKRNIFFLIPFFCPELDEGKRRGYPHLLLRQKMGFSKSIVASLSTFWNMLIFDEEKQQKQLEELRKREEEDLVRIMAETKYNMTYVNLAAVPLENEALRVVPEEEARKLEVAPFKILGKKIHIAIISPKKDGMTAFKENLEKRGFQVFFYMVSHESLKRVWSRYKEISYAEQAKAGGLDVSGEVLLSIAKKIKRIRDIEPLIEKTKKTAKFHTITKIFEVILAGAVALNISDIHIEPEEKDVLLRYRLDGVLQNVLRIDYKIYKLINTRIKLLSGMKITITKNAQDGRFGIFIKGTEINVRTSTAPGEYGESIVMRLLNPESIKVELEELGIEARLFKVFDKEIKKPNGMILVTGPTGSGKTTTLYAFLRRIFTPDIKIITIEDPVEYHLQGITQTQVNREKKYDFLAGLRAALRQDPDVIMVGEIRDNETAEIAINASLTGHIVFSTLHTNSAAGVIPRLIDLGINPKIIPSALTLSIAQRLLRKLCTNCKKEKIPTLEEEKDIRRILKEAEEEGKDLAYYKVSSDQEIKIWEAVGCDICNNTGYKGRIGVFEAILSDEHIEDIITKNPSDREIKRVAQVQGILDMKEDGVINKILLGITSLDELKRNVNIYED